MKKHPNKWQFYKNLNLMYLETMYLTFIRPLLEYAGEVWVNCTLAASERLEKIQLEAAHDV